MSCDLKWNQVLSQQMNVFFMHKFFCAWKSFHKICASQKSAQCRFFVHHKNQRSAVVMRTLLASGVISRGVSHYNTTPPRNYCPQYGICNMIGGGGQ